MAQMDRALVRLTGARCSVCRKGTLAFEYSLPTKRPMGHVKKYFRCSECKCVHVETNDPRFVGNRSDVGTLVRRRLVKLAGAGEAI